MELISTREKVLKQVRLALTGPKESIPAISNHESQVFYLPTLDVLAESFKKQFENKGGNCFICANKYDFIDQLIEYLQDLQLSDIVVFNNKIQNYLDSCSFEYQNNNIDVINADAAIVNCEYLVANSGIILQTDSNSEGRSILTLPPVQCVMAFKDQLVAGEQHALEKLKNRYDGDLPGSIHFHGPANFSLDYDYKPRKGAFGAKNRTVFIILER